MGQLVSLYGFNGTSWFLTIPVSDKNNVFSPTTFKPDVTLTGIKKLAIEGNKASYELFDSFGSSATFSLDVTFFVHMSEQADGSVAGAKVTVETPSGANTYSDLGEFFLSAGIGSFDFTSLMTPSGAVIVTPANGLALHEVGLRYDDFAIQLYTAIMNHVMENPALIDVLSDIVASSSPVSLTNAVEGEGGATGVSDSVHISGGQYTVATATVVPSTLSAESVDAVPREYGYAVVGGAGVAALVLAFVVVKVLM